MGESMNPKREREREREREKRVCILIEASVAILPSNRLALTMSA